jgi:acyl CoA:acetate/3-ketoacid CoA transferase beta subunit
MRDPAADQMIACMSRLIEEGDFLAEGIGTFMPNAAYLLAKRTHAPDCLTLCPNGNALWAGHRTLTLGRDERVTTRGSMLIDYVGINLMYMPMLFVGGRPRWTEFMRPAQIDPLGWTNNVCIGPYARPRMRLPGAAGIPDASPVARRFYYYIPRHTPLAFVAQLDFASGVGNPRPGQAGNVRPITVITNLCVMTTGADGRLAVTSLHPGIDAAQVAAATGFALTVADDVATSDPPTPGEQALLDEIDPLGLRYLESLPGAARRAEIGRLAALETGA